MGASRLHFISLLISAVTYGLVNLILLICGLQSYWCSWKLLVSVLLVTSLIGLIDHYKFDMNMGLRIAKTMKLWRYQTPPKNMPPDEYIHRAKNQIWEGYIFIVGPLYTILSAISGVL
jgi:hypothetical protein